MTITSVLKEERVFPPPADFAKKANIGSMAEYHRLYDKSINQPMAFWSDMSKRIDWLVPFKKIHEQHGDFHEWFTGGKLNVSYNCIDRHLKKRAHKTALLWIGQDGSDRHISYQTLYEMVNKAALGLRQLGVKKGDRICIYLPMIPEAAVAMLACTRIGAVHSIVFGGFSAQSLRDRIDDCGAKVVITSDGSYYGAKIVPLKANTDEAVEGCKSVEHVVVVKRTKTDVHMKKSRDLWWDEWLDGISGECEPEPLESEDPLFILYTSGTTGKPKGVLHTTAGYLLMCDMTFHYVFDYHENDIYYCTADIGWVTGHSYVVYGPLSNGATSVMFEGIPTYPTPDRFWELIEKYKISIFYTAPTAIRALMREGDEWVKKHNLSSLRLLGSVGEPINPQAWMWYYNVVGQGRCPIVDTWWQTETGAIMISPLPGVTPLKPGSGTLPFFGIEPKILNDEGHECGVDEGGYLVINRTWPSMLRTIYGDAERYKETYFGKFSGKYLTGDGARRDKDGYFWIVGRIDDVINVSGHRIGTAEIESALVSHLTVAEAAVVPFPHSIKGHALYAFVTLKQSVAESPALMDELKIHVGKMIGGFAKPDKIQFAPRLPKTRSGKIMRRILKSIAEGNDDFGNVSTLADPSVVEELLKSKS